MCGIFGCVLKEGNVAPIIHQALKRLEYRGYDSVGEATIHEGKLYIKRIVGKSRKFTEFTTLTLCLET